MKFKRFISVLLVTVFCMLNLGGLFSSFGILVSADICSKESLMSSEKCGDNLTWSLDDYGTLTITGEGSMYDWDLLDYTFAPWRGKGSAIRKVIIEFGVTRIGNEAFYDYYHNLKEVIIPDSVTSIGCKAFGCCRSLTSIDIPSSVQSIGTDAFDTTNLATVSLPDGIEYIDCFRRCSFSEIIIPSSVKWIGPNGFCGCDNLEEITIPEGVDYVSHGAFAGCTSLSHITFLNPNCRIEDDSVPPDAAIHCYGGSTAFEYALKNKNPILRLSEPVICASGNIGENSKWTLDDYGVLTISGNGEIGRPPTSQTKGYPICNIVIENGVTSISEMAFMGLNEFSSISLPDSVKTIGACAFDSCIGLTSVTLPISVQNIGYGAFCDCMNLKDITILNSECTIEDASGTTIPQNTVIHGLKDSTASEYASNYQRKFEVISGIEASGNCGENLTWELDSDGTFTISGIGKLSEWKYPDEVPWYSYLKEKIKTVIIQKGVTNIGYFYGCSSLTSVTIPDSVTSIEAGAFKGCTSLTSITIPNSVTSIGGGAFIGCTSLTSITIPNSVTSIGSSAFSDCTNLTSITIPNNVTSVESHTFYKCISLTSITIPNSVTSIGNCAFCDCISLTSITIPDSVTSIGDNAFYNCTNLISVNLPDSVTSIGDWAFYRCTSLSSVAIPKNVENFGYGSFCGCTSLTDITVDPDNALFTDEGGVLFNKKKTELMYYPSGRRDEAYTIPDSVTSIGESSFATCISLISVTIPKGVTIIREAAFRGCDGLSSITFPDSITSIGNLAFDRCTNLKDVIILNPECEIPNATDTISETAAIYGYTGSTAETYAKLYFKNFVALDSEWLKGDVDGDGEIINKDAQRVLVAYTESLGTGVVDLLEVAAKAADVDGDGKVGVSDAQYILIYYTANTISGNPMAWEELIV